MDLIESHETDLPLTHFCLVCCNEIDPLTKDELKPPNLLDDIFFVVSNYMKWNETGNQFQFQKEVFPFCEKCLPTIETIFELNGQVHNLLRRIDQLCETISGDILLSRSKCEVLVESRNSELSNIKGQGNGESDSSSGAYQFDDQKVCSFRNVIYKRFTPTVQLTPLQKSITEEYRNKWSYRDIWGSSTAVVIKEEDTDDLLGLPEEEEPTVQWPEMNVEYRLDVPDESSGAANVKVETFDQHFGEDEGTFITEDEGTYEEDIEGSNTNVRKASIPNPWDITNRVRTADGVHFIFDEKYPFEKMKDAWKCGTCEQIYKSKVNLDSHLLASCSGCKVPGPRNRFVKIGPNVFMYAEMFKVVKTGEDKYECSTCSSEFSSRRRILRHMRLHFNANKFTCSICGKGYARRYLRDDHQRMHTNEKPFMCFVCGRQYSRKSGLKIHLKGNYCKSRCSNNTRNTSNTVAQQHDIEEESELNKTFSPNEENSILSNHGVLPKWNFVGESLTDEDREVKIGGVDFDSDSFESNMAEMSVYDDSNSHKYGTTIEESNEHSKTEDVPLSLEELASEKVNASSSILQNETSSYSWKIANGVRQANDQLSLSYGNIANDCMFMCGACGMQCKSKQDMDTHLLSSCSGAVSVPRKGHRNRSNFVEISPGVFLYANKYKAVKTGPDQYKCLQANCESVLRRTGIIRHLFYHLNAARFSCGVCGKEFSRKNRLDEHERRHTSRSVIECQICNFQFLSKAMLKKHLKELHNLN
ncbi:unnamed protein product [Allacma fusca]|uniref:C2H2-type domain-containing protein n=1 Tax=Allacma fusca TaxID=39272 RepID=A0A8J2KZL8_9HEXA|nr:unnamed protein product [Allacma fusca]